MTRSRERRRPRANGLPNRNAPRARGRIARVWVSTHIPTTAVRQAKCNSNIPVEDMLDTLRQFIADVVSPTTQVVRSFDDTGYRLAATALLVHVISLDGEPSQIKKR